MTPIMFNISPALDIGHELAAVLALRILPTVEEKRTKLDGLASKP
jgi:hypothetical protein